MPCILPDLYFLCPKYLSWSTNGFDVRIKSRRCSHRRWQRRRRKGPANIVTAYWGDLVIRLMVSHHRIHAYISTRTTRMPAFWGYPPLPHDYPYYWVILDPKSKKDKVKVTNLKNLPKFQTFEFWNKRYTLHTFWSCLIRCGNMKWMWGVLLKIQSWHDSVHRRTDIYSEIDCIIVNEASCDENPASDSS